MTAKEFLSRYKTIDREIDCMMAELGRLRALMYQTGSSANAHPRRRGKQSGASFEKIVAKYIDLENAMNEKIDQLLDVKAEIEQAIDRVEDDTLRLLLRLRYMKGMTWERIALEMHYSYMHVCRLHRLALQKVKM
mgnify:CR=1 FL=1